MKSNIQIGISTTSSVSKSYILALNWLEISTKKNDYCYFDIKAEQYRGKWKTYQRDAPASEQRKSKGI